ncbi:MULTISPECIES: dTMP kinase [Candidatus Ichthyocystis]|uniref:dTMP kinase n=1 Tax=Candidatus Ichthyocystis TaxID=2929841 RepID=UPI000ADC8363|nr:MULTISPECIES: dTMP kinase [Ichthyocystis]
MKKGYFITLEGLDGVGKSTHASWLESRLGTCGYSVLKTREPGGTDYGERLRPIFLCLDISVEAECMLAMSMRLQHVSEKILPALSSGQYVVCERFMDATYAYQSGGRGMSYSKIYAIEKVLTLPNVDLTFFLDAPFDVLRQRLDPANVDRFELQSSDFFARVRAIYQRRIQEDPCRFVVIDATQPIDIIREIIDCSLVDKGIISSSIALD